MTFKNITKFTIQALQRFWSSKKINALSSSLSLINKGCCQGHSQEQRVLVWGGKNKLQILFTVINIESTGLTLLSSNVPGWSNYVKSHDLLVCCPSIVFDGIFLDISPQKSKNYWLPVLTTLLLTVTKGEFTKTSIFFGKILRSKLYYAIVLSKEFHLNGNTIWFKRKNDIPSGKLEDKNCTIVSVYMVIWVTGRQ